MPAHLVRRRDFVTGLGAIAVLAGDTPKLFADEPVYGVRRVRGRSSYGRAFPAIAAATMPENLVIGSPGLGILRSNAAHNGRLGRFSGPCKDAAASCALMHSPISLEESLARVGYVELRRYGFHCAEDCVEAHEAFIRNGIQPLLMGEAGDFLFGFETLASRERAWRELSWAPQWLQLRAHLEDLAIYKVTNDAALQPGGMILEMSL